MQYLPLILILISLTILSNVQCISITSATRQVKSGNLLGAPVSVGVFEVEFDEDIAVTKTYGQCLNRTCAPANSCAPCDYTDAAVCSGSRSTGPCACPVGPICDIATTLQLDQPYNAYLGPDAIQEFKVYIGNESCKFVYIRLETQFGDPDLYVATASKYNDEGFTSAISDRYGPETAILCPADLNYELGTIAILVYSFPSEYFAQGVGANITLTVSLHDIPDPVQSPLPCTPTSPLHTCITDDEFITFAPSNDTNGIRYFEMDLPQSCTPISFFASRGTLLFFSYTDPKPSQNDDVPSVFFRGIDLSGGLQRDAFVLCPQNLGISKLYISVTQSTFNSSHLSVSTNPGWIFYEPLTRYDPFQYVFESYGTTMLTTPARTTSFGCFYRLYTTDNDCRIYWTVSPTADVVPLFPRPSFTAGVADFNQMMLLDVPAPPKANKFATIVMLNYTLDLKTISITDEEEIQTVTMHFLGRLVDKNHMPIQMNITFEDKNLGCDANKLQTTIEEMNVLLDEQQTILNGQRLSDIRYQLDVTSMYDNLYGCREFVTELYDATIADTTIETSFCLAPANTSEFTADPCCNLNVSWTGPACFVREAPYQVGSFISTTSAAESCYAPQCLSIFIENYVSKSSVAGDNIIGCSSNTPRELPYRVNLLTTYGRCKDLAFGVFPDKGIECWRDEDCNGNKCDMLENRCLIDLPTQFDTFFNCFLTEADPFIITTVESAKNILSVGNVGADSNLQQWKAAFTTTDCTGLHELALNYRSRWSLQPGFASVNCPFCETFECLDKRCTVPVECDKYIDSNCFKVWTEIQSNGATCNAVRNCNWFDCSTAEVDCVTTCTNNGTASSFCGATENGFDYVEVPSITDINDCNSAAGCILHDKTVVVDSNCATTMRCNATCWTGNTPRACADEIECTSTGDCIGDEFLGSSGACVFEMSPFQIPACGTNKLNTNPTVPTNLGCVDQSISTPVQCQNNNGTWMTPPRTEAECAAHGFGCIETFVDEAFINGFMMTFKNEADCQAVGGNYVPVLTWRAGTWEGGIVKDLEWVPRALYQPYSMNQTLDFVSLYEEISVAIESKYAFELKTQSKCFYGQQLDLLNVISCSCNPSGLASEQCFASWDPTSTDGVNVICQGVNGTLTANNALAYYSADTLDAPSTCITVGIGAVAIGEFRYSTPDALSSFLVDFSQDNSYSFTNDLGSIVGRLIGDGVSFRFTDASLRNVEICVNVDNVPDSFVLSNYPVLDFATVDVSTNDVKPLGIEVRVNETVYCSTVALIEPTDNIVYFPVVRVENWSTDQPSLPLTDSELALLIISIVCYAFCFVYCLVKAAMILRYKLHKQLNFAVILLLGALCLVRLLFYLLSVGGVFATQNSHGVYILVELPSFIYFSALSFFVVLWVFTMRLIRKPSISRSVMNKRIIRVVAILNAVLYAVFIVLIILYETLPDGDNSICGGRLITRDLSTRQSIAMVYRLIVSILSFALGAGYLINGFRVYGNMVQSDKKSARSSDKHGTKKRIFWTATICAIGLLLQCGFLLGLLFSGYRNNTVAMAVLIAVEVVPITTVVSILRIIDAKQKLSRSTTGSATGRSINFGTSTSASKDAYPGSGDMTSKNETTEEELKVTRVPSGIITTRTTATHEVPTTPRTALTLAQKEDPDEVYPSDESSSSSESSSSEIVASYASHSSIMRNNSFNHIVSQTSLITPVTSPRAESSSANNTPRGQQESNSNGSTSSSPSDNSSS